MLSACSGTGADSVFTPAATHAPSVTELHVSPHDTTVGPNAAIQFQTVMRWSGAGSAPSGASSLLWTTEDGYVSSAGTHTAAFSPGTYRVIATLAGGSLADTAHVTVDGTPVPVPVVIELTIEPRDTSVAPGQPVPYRLAARWSDGALTLPPIIWNSERGQMSSSGVHVADSADGSYRVIATLQSGELADTTLVKVDAGNSPPPPAPPPPPPPPTPPPPAPGGWSEPAGFMPIVGRHFNTLGTVPSSGRGIGAFPWKASGSEGWDDVEGRYSQNIRLWADSSAPLSPPGIVRMLYPAHTVAQGTTYSPGVSQMMGLTTATSHYGQGRHYRKLYFRTAFRVSANWQGHPSSTNKMFFVRSEAGHEPIVRLRGAGSNALQLNVDLQGSIRDRRNIGTQSSLTPNRGVPAANNVQRGRWYVLEGVLEIGTNGQADGRLRLWLDGVLTHDYADIEYEATAVRSDWGYIHIAPTWGGTHGTINQLMWMDFDEFYVSGAP